MAEIGLNGPQKLPGIRTEGMLRDLLLRLNNFDFEVVVILSFESNHQGGPVA